MEIKKGKYTIYSDKYCYWITEKVKNESKRKVHDHVETKVAGYSPTVRQLKDDFLEQKLKGCKAKEVEDALKTISDALDDAKEIFEVRA